MKKLSKTAWIYLFRQDYDHNKLEIVPVGNGKQWQYPIFYTRSEARNWKKDHNFHMKLVKCDINVLD